MHASPPSSPLASAAPSAIATAQAGASPSASRPPASPGASPRTDGSAEEGGQPACPLCRPQREDRFWQEPRLRIIHVHDEAGQPAYFRVIWQAHVAEMTDLSDEDRQHLWTVLTLLESGVRRFLAPDKINLASLGNQVPHLHWHVIGRWADDPQFPGSVWSPVRRPADSGPQQQNAQRVAAALPALRAWLADQLMARQR